MISGSLFPFHLYFTLLKKKQQPEFRTILPFFRQVCYLDELSEWALKYILDSDGVCVPNVFGKCSEGNYFVLIQTDTIQFSLNKMLIVSHFCVRTRDGGYWIRSKHCWDLLRWELSSEETHLVQFFFLVAQLNFALRHPIGCIHIYPRMPHH